MVEFAIRTHNGKNLEKSMWLPVDSKLPKEDYEALTEAYEAGDVERIDSLRKAFRNGIIKNAKCIR